VRIAGLIKSTLIDFPGCIACVVFTAGCTYDCFYCHNRALIGGDAVALPMKELWRFLESRVGLLGGVVVSGGEPTLQPGLKEFLGSVKRLGYAVKLDTNGSKPAVVGELLADGLVDYVALDVKAPWERYREIGGLQAEAAAVEATLRLLASASVAYEVRTTLCPTLMEDDVLKIARSMPPVPRWRLNKYVVPQSYKEQEAYRVHAYALQGERLQRLVVALRKAQGNVLDPD
jgi:pyruvate formate lyase activating enzyme